MKNLLLVIAVLLSTITFAQENNEPEVSAYVATGLSMTNSGNFQESSYISAEIGFMVDNFAVGIVAGRNNLKNLFQGGENWNDYWLESKLAVYQPIGFVDGYVLFGVGGYVENSNIFIEYGAGISKQFGSLGVFVQVSNWDGTTYLTPGISFSL